MGGKACRTRKSKNRNQFILIMEDKTIMWGFEPKPQPESIRSEEHQEYLIATWNAHVPKEKQVTTILELIEALKSEVEEAIKENQN